MKKTEMKEITCCDVCGKESYLNACMKCGIEHCYDCEKIAGKKYPHGVHFSGSGDGYYCVSCDAELTKGGTDIRHAAYRAITSLRNEGEAWGVDFNRRSKEAESRLEALGSNFNEDSARLDFAITILESHQLCGPLAEGQTWREWIDAERAKIQAG